MPIEFRCPQCQKLLRTPDASAGKKAKCPQCATTVQIPNAAPPAAPTPPAPVPEAEDPLLNFNPTASAPPTPDLSGLPDLSSWSPAASSPAPSINPYSSPSMSATNYAKNTSYANGPGLPWETQPKSFNSFWRTVKMIFNSPTASFQKMKNTGGLGDQIIFAIIGNLIGLGTLCLYVFLFYGVIFSLVIGAAGDAQAGAAVGFGLLMMAVMLLVFVGIGATLGSVIGVFLNGAILHVCLSLVGGAKQSFETTARVVAYVMGSTAMLLAIPCGHLVQGIFALVYLILGLASAHRIDGGKATLAVFLPTLILCGAFALLYGLGFLAAVGGGAFR